jgi:hypothetical protein
MQELRNWLLARTMGEQEVAAWLRWRDVLQTNPSQVPDEVRELVEPVQDRVQETYFEE